MDINSNMSVSSGSYYIPPDYSKEQDPKQELNNSLSRIDHDIRLKEAQLAMVEYRITMVKYGGPGDLANLKARKAELESEISQLNGQKAELIEKYINDTLDPQIKTLQDKIAQLEAEANSISDPAQKELLESQIAMHRQSLKELEQEKASLQNSSIGSQSAVTSNSELTKATENEQTKNSTRSSLKRLRTPGIRI